MPNTRLLIVGYGSIGQRHHKVLTKLAPDMEIGLLRHSTVSDSPPGLLIFEELEAVLAWRPQAAILSNPSPYRIDIAHNLRASGIPLLLEKPLSNNLEKAKAFLSNNVNRQNDKCLMGYCLRFSPALIAFRLAIRNRVIGDLLWLDGEVGQYLPDWRPDMDYRKSVSAQGSLGGGALSELSHEIDYINWITGELPVHVSATLACSGQLEIDVEDIASLTFAYGNNVLATLRLDMLQRDPVRRCKAVGSKGTLVWDAIEDSVFLFDDKGGQKQLFGSTIKTSRDMYENQMRHFLACVTKNELPAITVLDGVNVLKVIEAARRSDAEGRRIDMDEI